MFGGVEHVISHYAGLVERRWALRFNIRFVPRVVEEWCINRGRLYARDLDRHSLGHQFPAQGVKCTFYGVLGSTIGLM